jgi:hypothetical protein
MEIQRDENPLFLPRRRLRAASEKSTTVDAREREYARVGLSAAELKIKGKWRQRKYRALQRAKSTREFQTMLKNSGQSCFLFVQHLSQGLDQARDAELAAIRRDYMQLGCNTRPLLVHLGTVLDPCV